MRCKDLDLMIFGFIVRKEEGGMETRPSLRINLITKALSAYLVPEILKIEFHCEHSMFKACSAVVRSSLVTHPVIPASFPSFVAKTASEFTWKCVSTSFFGTTMTIWWKILLTIWWRFFLDMSRSCARCRQMEIQTDQETNSDAFTFKITERYEGFIVGTLCH